MASSLETDEKIGADIAHALPVVLIVWKRISREHMRSIIGEGRTHLHLASEQLKQEECKTALERENLYLFLCAETETLRSEADELKGKISSLKCHQLLRKYGVYRLIMRWKERAHEHKHVVWAESDRAIIDLMNAQHLNNAHPAPDDNLARARPLNSPSQLTMVDVDLEISISTSEDDGNDDDSVLSIEVHVPPETLDSNSVFRNHWGRSE